MPAAAGAAVLIAAVAGALAVRGRRAPAPPAPALAVTRAPRLVAVPVISVPAGAEVRRGRTMVALTPARLEVAPGTTLELELRKPGYAPARRVVEVGEAPVEPAPVILAEVNGFEGVWQLPSGELRAFTRRGERVEVSKLEAVHGARAFYRHFQFVTSEVGVAFTSVEDVLDPRAPDEPSCRIPHATTYLYEPARDALTASQERVRTDLVEGRCVVRARDVRPPLALVRVDRAPTAERETVAPVGRLPIANVEPAPRTLRAPLTKKAPRKPGPKAAPVELGGKVKAALPAQAPQQRPYTTQGSDGGGGAATAAGEGTAAE